MTRITHSVKHKKFCYQVIYFYYQIIYVYLSALSHSHSQITYIFMTSLNNNFAGQPHSIVPEALVTTSKELVLPTLYISRSTIEQWVDMWKSTSNSLKLPRETIVSYRYSASTNIILTQTTNRLYANYGSI